MKEHGPFWARWNRLLDDGLDPLDDEELALQWRDDADLLAKMARFEELVDTLERLVATDVSTPLRAEVEPTARRSIANDRVGLRMVAALLLIGITWGLRGHGSSSSPEQQSRFDAVAPTSADVATRSGVERFVPRVCQFTITESVVSRGEVTRHEWSGGGTESSRRRQFCLAPATRVRTFELQLEERSTQ